MRRSWPTPHCNEIDREKLTALIETSFNGKLLAEYLDQLKPHIHRIYLSESYRAVAIITRDRSDPSAVPYLDKFAVAKSSQSEGTGQALWSVLRRDIPSLFWRSRRSNPINSWYFEHSDGGLVSEPWVIFWYGLQGMTQVSDCIDKARAKPTSIDRSQPFRQPHESEADSTSHLIAAAATNPFVSASARASTPPPHHNPPSAAPKRGLHTLPHRTFSTSRTSLSSRSSSSSNTQPSKVGLIGGRGHTGGELISLIAAHPHLSLTVISSRALKGQPVSQVFPHLPPTTPWASITFTDLKPDELPAQDVDVWVLALPNDLAAPYVHALDAARSPAKVVDLSADHRFSGAWAYGFPEHRGYRDIIARASRVSNPGCYATAAQVALLPLEGMLDVAYPPTVFGVSGYSGAGTTPSRKNDPKELKDNLMPYALLDHMHEREVSHQLRPWLPGGIRFMPHVAPWFRGISLTTAVQLKGGGKGVERSAIVEAYERYFEGERLVRVVKNIPEVREVQGKHDVVVGGFVTDGKGRLVVTSVIDNLLKGAATQCMQNINLVLGYDEYAGIPVQSSS